MRRTVIIGDVHGCAAELDELLDRVAPGSADRFVFVGDLVARGPDSRGVLDRFRALGARGCRGNHESRMLEARRARRAGEPLPPLGESHQALLGELTDEDWATLDALELWIDLPDHDVRVVHAGIVAGVPMSEQDPWALMHMRSLDDAGMPSAQAGAQHWSVAYRDGPHVVFGHDARRGLQLNAAATGLDTACVYGERLTALVLDGASRVPPVADRRSALVSVPARKRYYAPHFGS